jgi:thymidylate synthase (FAD)
MVKLVSVTHPVLSDLSGFTPEELIVYIARVSNPSNQLNKETAHRLIGYLIKHKHWSPFEFVDMTVEITTRRSIAAQILRHWSFSFQEFSQRYSNATKVQPIELRKQADKNRQSSAEILNDEQLELLVENAQTFSTQVYNKLLEAGVAREVARDVLPLSTETTMYMKGSVRDWIHYLELRTLEDTQKEHREIANAIMELFKENFPNIHKAITQSKEG